MRPFSRKLVSCFTLCIFMLGLGTHFFNTQWLMHDFCNQHGRNTFGLLAEQTTNQQSALEKYKGTQTASKSLSNAEHRLLHAADPGHPVLLAFASNDSLAVLREARFSVPVTVISSADSQPPFRPPSISSFA